MEINNPQVFDHIKEIDGDVLRPETLTDAEIDSVSKADEPTAWKQDSDNKYSGAPFIHSRDGKIIIVKVMDIGDWDMDTDAYVTIDTGIHYNRILFIIPKIRRDDTAMNDEDRYFLGNIYPCGGDNKVFPYHHTLDADTEIRLYRCTGGPFDSTNFDETPFNRGWITIFYTESSHE